MVGDRDLPRSEMDRQPGRMPESLSLDLTISIYRRRSQFNVVQRKKGSVVASPGCPATQAIWLIWSEGSKRVCG